MPTLNHFACNENPVSSSRPALSSASKHTSQDAASLLLLVAPLQALGEGPESQSLENTVQAERAQEPVYESTQPQTAQESPH